MKMYILFANKFGVKDVYSQNLLKHVLQKVLKIVSYKCHNQFVFYFLRKYSRHLFQRMFCNYQFSKFKNIIKKVI